MLDSFPCKAMNSFSSFLKIKHWYPWTQQSLSNSFSIGISVSEASKILDEAPFSHLIVWISYNKAFVIVPVLTSKNLNSNQQIFEKCVKLVLWFPALIISILILPDSILKIIKVKLFQCWYAWWKIFVFGCSLN